MAWLVPAISGVLRLPMTEDFAPAPFAGRDLLCRRGERLVFRQLDFDLAPGGAVLLLRRNPAAAKQSRACGS